MLVWKGSDNITAL